MARRIQLNLACGALLLGVACPAAAQPTIRDGLWEMTMTMDMGAMGGKMPPRTMQHCVTPQEAKDPTAFGRGMERDDQCQMINHQVSGNTATWNMTCKGKGPKGEGARTVNGNATYGGTTFSMTNTVTTTQDGKPMTMTMNQTGKYIGPCMK